MRSGGLGWVGVWFSWVKVSLGIAGERTEGRTEQRVKLESSFYNSVLTCAFRVHCEEAVERCLAKNRRIFRGRIKSERTEGEFLAA